MKKERRTRPPEWLFVLLAAGCAWASGIYLGKITIAGAAEDLVLKTAFFGVIGLVILGFTIWNNRNLQ